jgi:hypothetical protein
MQELVMEVIKVGKLKQEVPRHFSPSKLGWISACPLRARYENPSNARYYGAGRINFSAMLGNVVHQVMEQSNFGKISNQEDFERYWTEYERKQLPSGLIGRVKNYGKIKYFVGKQSVKPLVRRFGTVGGQPMRIEKQFVDEVTGIKGRPDLVVFKEGVPVEVKDYKSGTLFERQLIASDDVVYDLIRLEYRQQLLSYALLVYSEYKVFPQILSIVGIEGEEVSSAFRLEDLYEWKDKILTLKEDVLNLPDQELAIPNADNCRHCVYKPGCEFVVQDTDYHLRDFRGIIKEMVLPTFGNFILILEGGYRVFSKNIADRQDFGLLTPGAAVYLTNLYPLENQAGFLVFSVYSRVFVLENG